MKTDLYLNLCLEQAELSSLKHRHGCIVVKGGKVIGKGFNDYRPGFDGGALKTGSLSTRVPVLEEQRQRKNSSGKEEKQGKKNFKPFEETVGLLANGQHHANHSLTMHSEMMAINAALASSSTGAAATLSHLKLPAGSSRDSKRRRRQRQDVLQAYADRVCHDAHAPGSQAQQVTGPASNGNHQQKHHHQNQNRGLKPQQKQVRSNRNKAANSHNKAFHESQWTPFGKNKSFWPNSSSDIDDDLGSISSKTDSEAKSTGSLYLECSKTRRSSNNLNGNSAPHNTRDRIKHPRIRGADVYIARLGGKTRMRETGITTKTPDQKQNVLRDDPPHDSDQSPVSSPTTTTAPMVSLHDELKCKESKAPSTIPRTSSSNITSTDHRCNVSDSKPCYRCVLYMHSAGIRRVFWTNGQGKWESAKIRDLFDQISGVSQGTWEDGNSDAKGIGDIFVTKHEILMLRRLLTKSGATRKSDSATV